MHKKFLFSLSGGDRGKIGHETNLVPQRRRKVQFQLYENNIKK